MARVIIPGSNPIKFVGNQVVSGGRAHNLTDEPSRPCVGGSLHFLSVGFIEERHK